MTGNNIIYKEATIFYTVTGTGKTIVLVHGFGEEGSIWQPQVDFLKDKFRVIVPDMPGSGQSTFLEDANIDIYADIIKEILDREEQKLPSDEKNYKVTIVGHSMGGYITLAFAEKFPQHLNSFGLFHSSAFADDKEKKEGRDKAIEFIRNKGAYTFLKTVIPNLFTKDFGEKNPEKIADLLENGKKFTNETLIQYYEAMIARPDRTAVLKSFIKPILFIIGEHDLAIPLDISLQQCHLPVQSDVHILNQSAHMGLWEEKEKVNNILLDFLVNNI